MPRKPQPLPPLIDPASRPRRGVRAMMIRRMKLKYPELSESQIARFVGCSPSNVHQVLQNFREGCFTKMSKMSLPQILSLLS